VAVAALLLAAAAAAGACALDVLDSPAGTPLARVPLAANGAFALRYTHSVTLRPVESRYELRAGRIVQTAEAFDAHGPGMATEAQPGERWETQYTDAGQRFVLHMTRPLPQLVVRLHPLPSFRLLVGARTIDLDQWGARAVELRPNCVTERDANRP
jgi:hypothetical protein